MLKVTATDASISLDAHPFVIKFELNSDSLGHTIVIFPKALTWSTVASSPGELLASTVSTRAI